MPHFKTIASLVASTLIAFGCASKEEPAAKAVAASEAALAEVRVDAMKYAPEELKGADIKLAALESNLKKREFKAVLDGAPALDKEVALLKETVRARQTQMAAAANEWERLKAEVPKMVDAIQGRIDSLSGKRLPPEVKKESFEAAKASLTSMKATWAEAIAASGAGRMAEAADKGRAVQEKAGEAFDLLGMSPI